MTATIHHGDCLDVLRGMPDNSVDAICCDPPYGLSNTSPQHVIETMREWANGNTEYVPAVSGGFMGAAWDSFVPPPAVWTECFRVLKPGGHLATFSGTRTIGLMDTSVRLAGFDHRDTIGAALAAWVTGQGFPKSLNVAKATGDPAHEGLGTALKPSWEPILLYRKPLAEKTVAANVTEHGTGALNIAATRIGPKPDDVPFKYAAKAPKKERPRYEDAEGRTIQHPTTKPLTIMRWITALTCPEGGTVLDPFAGSGTTVEAAILEGFNVIGIEREEAYLPLIQQRIDRANDVLPMAS